MKRSSEYLIKELEAFSNKFEFTSVRYAYDYTSEFHVIEIERNSSLGRDLDFAKWKTGLWHKFYANYPTEDLLVTSLNKIKDFSIVLYEKAGHSFDHNGVGDYSFECLFVDEDITIFEQESLAA